MTLPCPGTDQLGSTTTIVRITDLTTEESTVVQPVSVVYPRCYRNYRTSTP